MMDGKGIHPQMALIQVSEIFLFTQSNPIWDDLGISISGKLQMVIAWEYHGRFHVIHRQLK